MKIAFICDTHLPNDTNSAQYVYLKKIIEKMKEDGIETVISVGDITAFGQKEIFVTYLDDLSAFDHHYVIGNAEVRDQNTKDYFLETSNGFLIERGGRRFLGVDTPYNKIEECDREKVRTLSDGDVLVMHNYVESLEKDSRAFITELCAEKALTIVHAHSHMRRDFALGRSRVIGLRALDPDKSIGGYPCIDYIDFGGEQVTYEEVAIKTPLSVLKDLRAHFGISCVDNLRDLTYALENNVYAVELRTNGADWTPDLSLLPLIEKWREKTRGYLSVHFPNLRYKNGEIVGKEQWYAATDYAIAVKADGLTMHHPRVRLCDMPESGEVWKAFEELYLYTINKVPASVRIGIENMHMEAGEGDNPQRGFGYTPLEVSAWIDTLNAAVGDPNRVGHVLDVGHARNNAHIASIYPIGRWYEMMGNKAVAYHIHQVLPAPKGGMNNHNAIETWLGPIINFSSFFYNWERGRLNHVPVFLEVQGSVNYQKSIDAFEKLLDNSESNI